MTNDSSNQVKHDGSQAALHFRPIEQLSEGIRSGALSIADVIRAVLSRIDAIEPHLNSFITVCPEEALADAARLQRELDQGYYRGPLHGVPVSVKDNISTAGIPTTAGSPVRRGYVPSSDASVVTSLKRAGAIVVAKANMSEFAFGGPHPDYGQVKNPWDLKRTPGGSSSGSAAAVAAGLGFGSLATDTGGSIRIPSAMCGVVGFKPSFGLLPSDGIVPVSANLDHVGPIARSVRDAATIFDALRAKKSEPALDTPKVQGLTIGVARSGVYEDVEPEVRAAMETCVAKLREAGASVREVHLPGGHDCWRVMTIIASVEAADFHHNTLRERASDLGPGLRHSLQRAQFLPATAYVRAQRVRSRILEFTVDAMAALDAVLLPSVPFQAHELARHAELLHARQRFTTLFNLTGMPALSLPVTLSNDSLPLSVQIASRHGDDDMVLRVGRFLESSLEVLPRPAGYLEYLEGL